MLNRTRVIGYTEANTVESYMKPINTSDSSFLQKSSACWLQLIDKVSHIFINKLAILRKKHTFLHKVIPSLIKGYHLAIEHKLMEDEIPKPLLENIHAIINLEEEIVPVFNILDSIGSFCNQLSINNTNQSFSIKNCVTDTLRTYEFEKDDRNYIQLNEDIDFDCYMPEFVIKTTIVTLLNFAFCNLRDLSDKNVHIWLENYNNSGALHFKIISKDAQKNYGYWLQNSLDISVDNVNPGINLCRLALIQYNGDITYQVTSGQSLEIIIEIQKCI